MNTPAGLGARRALLFTVSLLAGVAILVAACWLIDIPMTLAELGRIGLWGAAAFLVNILVTLAGPGLAWHLLMRAEGIPVRLWQTLASTLMGRAVNLVSPLMYFGGESVRVFHIAGACRVSKRRVLATVIVSEFQLLVGLTGCILLCTGVIAASSALAPGRVIAVALAGAGLAVFLFFVLGLFLWNAHPAVRILNLLIRCRIFPVRLSRVLDKAREMEAIVRDFFTRRLRVLILSQLASLISPAAQFLRPTLFYGLLRWSGATVALPTLSELSVFFVLSQLLFMVPTTPGGLGVYEGGLIGLFGLLSWPSHDGAAYSLLIRLDDLVFITLGAWLTVHFGMRRFLGWGRPPSAPAASLDDVEGQETSK